MTDLVQAAIRMGMSPEDIEILRSMPGGGVVDLGLPGPSASRIQAPAGSFSTYSAGRPGLTAMPDGPGSQPAAYMSRAQRGGMDTLSAVDAALGLPPQASRSLTAGVGKGVRGASKLMGFSPSAAGKAGRMAMQAMNNPALQVGLKYAPVVGAGLSLADLALGDESLGNKVMDGTLMTAGGALGSVVPVVGTALGVTGGKMVSDGLQWLFGDKMSPEERKVAQTLAALNGGVV